MAEKLDFAEFLRIRRDVCRYATWKKFAQASGVGEATIYKLIGDDPVSTNVSLDLRDKVAVTMQFDDWWGLVTAWKDGDVLQGMSVGTFMVDSPNGEPVFRGVAIPPHPNALADDKARPLDEIGPGKSKPEDFVRPANGGEEESLPAWAAKYDTLAEAMDALKRAWLDPNVKKAASPIRKADKKRGSQ